MAIITISRGSYSKGKEIAEKVAAELGYQCLSRDVLLEASELFNIDEVKLIRALHDAPGVLERFIHGKQKYVAFIQEAFLDHVRHDNLVYHGLAGHFFLHDVAHALKVRIIADLEDRVRLEVEREEISPERARHVLRKDDEERRKWALSLYNIDTADAILYDLVIHVRKIGVDDAVKMICETARLPQFATTDTSNAALDDLLMAARARSLVVQRWPQSEVSAKDGILVIHTPAVLAQEEKVSREITRLVGDVEGVKGVRVSVRPLI